MDAFNLSMEGARGIEPPPRFSDEADGFEARGAPSTIAPSFHLQRMKLLRSHFDVIAAVTAVKEWASSI